MPESGALATDKMFWRGFLNQVLTLLKQLLTCFKNRLYQHVVSHICNLAFDVDVQADPGLITAVHCRVNHSQRLKTSRRDHRDVACRS